MLCWVLYYTKPSQNYRSLWCIVKFQFVWNRLKSVGRSEKNWEEDPVEKRFEAGWRPILSSASLRPQIIVKRISKNGTAAYEKTIYEKETYETWMWLRRSWRMISCNNVQVKLTACKSTTDKFNQTGTQCKGKRVRWNRNIMFITFSWLNWFFF